MPIYESTVFDYKNLPDQVKPYVLASKGATKNGFRFTSQPTGTPDQFMSLMLESLRNTLARKRDQFRDKSERYVLILKLGHHRTTSEQLHELFRDRIWPNKDYDWVTCFGEFQPRNGFTIDSPSHNLSFQINPNGEPLAGPLLMGLLSGEKRFHTRDGASTAI